MREPELEELKRVESAADDEEELSFNISYFAKTVPAGNTRRNSLKAVTNDDEHHAGHFHGSI